jgi:hypothetical protein
VEGEGRPERQHCVRDRVSVALFRQIGGIPHVERRVRKTASSGPASAWRVSSGAV